MMCDFCGAEGETTPVEVYSPVSRSCVTLEACVPCEREEVWL